MATELSDVLVSVVVPVYNVEKWMDRCVGSILQQTHGNIQVILVDDGSTDRSGSKCEEWACLDSRIEVLHRENGGLSVARNTGMAAVKGEFVLFVDSDDAIGANHIANLLKATMAANARTVVAVTGYTESRGGVALACDPVASISFSGLTPEEAVIASVTLGERFAAHAWGKMYPRELYPLLEYPVGKYYEDQYVTFKVFLEADAVIYENANDYFYTVDRGESISNGSKIRHLDYLGGIRETLHSVRVRCPGAVSAVYLRYLVSLGGCLKISASEGDRRIFDDLFSEAVENRRRALAMSSLGRKTRIQFLATFLGKRLCRIMFHAHSAIRPNQNNSE